MSDDQPLDPADEHPVDPDAERPVDPGADVPYDPTLGDDMTVLTAGSESDGDLLPDEERPVPLLADEDDDDSDAAPV